MLQLLQRHLMRSRSWVGAAILFGVGSVTGADTVSTAPNTPPNNNSITAASQPADELVAKFTSFAGSATNAQALVNGLRNDAPVTLQATTPMTPNVTFTPPTAPMGFGNINIALSLAKAELAAQGITQPTPSQIQTALLGGKLSTASGTTDLPGILTLRSEGNGWGEIAHATGTRLGEVVRSDKAQRPDKDTGFAQAGKPERAERLEHAERLDRPARPERPDRPERPERPERVDRPDRQARR
jgi:hypothetical protein